MRNKDNCKVSFYIAGHQNDRNIGRKPLLLLSLFPESGLRFSLLFSSPVPCFFLPSLLNPQSRLLPVGKNDEEFSALPPMNERVYQTITDLS